MSLSLLLLCALLGITVTYTACTYLSTDQRRVYLHPSDLSVIYGHILVSFVVGVLGTHHSTSVWCRVVFSIALRCFMEGQLTLSYEMLILLYCTGTCSNFLFLYLY